MKKKILIIILLLIPVIIIIILLLRPKEALFAPVGFYRDNIHYVILFKYYPNTESGFKRDTLRFFEYDARGSLYKITDNGIYQLTNAIKTHYIIEQSGIDVYFLPAVFDKLISKAGEPKLLVVPTPQVVEGHTEHWKPAYKRGDGSFWMSGNENKGSTGDTIVLSGKYSYAYISQNYSSDVVIYTDGKGQVEFTSGLSIENSTRIKVDGSGEQTLYGILVSGGGTNISITGKSNYIDVGYVDLRNGKVGGLWDKTEVSDVQNKYNCDMSYLYPTRAMYHHLHHMSLRNIQGDALYEGSTGSTGGRPMTCNGQTTQPKPMGVGFVELDNIMMDSINRQGGQVSGCDTGYLLVHDNEIKNTGYEYNPQQGAGFAIGGAAKNAQVYNNKFHHNFLYNFYSYGDAVTEFYNNEMDTAAQVGTKGTAGWKANTEQIPATLFSPQHSGSRLSLKNNLTGYNTANSGGKPVGYVIYGSPQILNTGKDTFCNNVGNFVNSTGGVTFIAECDTIIPPPDTTKIPPLAIARVRVVLGTTAQSTLVTLLGDSSKDTDGTIVGYKWEQLSGGATPISDATASQTRVSGFVKGNYKYKLTVTDNKGLTNAVTITIVVGGATTTVTEKYGTKF